MRKQILGCTIFLFGIINPAVTQVTPGEIVEETIDSYLSTPAANSIETIPVIILRYLPTVDGINLDVAKATDYFSLGNITLDDLEENIDKYLVGLKFSLEEGSKFHGYSDPDAVPYLGYRVIEYWTIYDQIPISNTFLAGYAGGDPVHYPDFIQIFDDFNLEQYVNESGVKEIWIWYGQCAMPGWPSYDPLIHLPENYVEFVESNMSSPTTGDISNSYRFSDDIPICDNTVVTYCYNFRRTQAEAVHNHGHQLESIYKYAAEQQDGNYNLFVHDFSGWGEYYSTPPIGRAGDCHHPPNTTQDYDYLNTTLVESDIEDWKPAVGTKTYVNVDTWGNIDYNWPTGYYFPQQTESQWYIYWMQNMPGYNNQIPYNSNFMTNWWRFTADWDSCHNNSVGLYSASNEYQPCLNIPVFTDSRNGKTYNTVQIGSQCWMKENLNIGTRITGSQQQINNGTIEKYCYADLESNCNEYGGLYQWAEMVQYLNGASNTTSWSPVPTDPVQGICPVDWHIPSSQELTTLTTFLGGASVAGGKMKEAGLAHWASPNTGGNNISGFTALSGGFHFGPGGYQYFSTNALFWSSTEGSSTNAWYRILAYNNQNAGSYNDGGKADGFSVRCIYNDVPTNSSLQNIGIYEAVDTCFDALQIISVAGGGTFFNVGDNGDATLIAGQKVLLLPGTSVSSGGHLLAKITTTGTYCGTMKSSIVCNPAPDTEDQTGPALSGRGFRVFPNPTTCKFNLEFDREAGPQDCFIQVFSMTGTRVISEELKSIQTHQFSVADQIPGIYIIQVIRGDRVDTEKIIKE